MLAYIEDHFFALVWNLWGLRIMSEIWLYDYNYGVSLPLSEHVDIFPVRLVSTFHRVFSVYLTLAIYLT